MEGLLFVLIKMGRVLPREDRGELQIHQTGPDETLRVNCAWSCLRTETFKSYEVSSVGFPLVKNQVSEQPVLQEVKHRLLGVQLLSMKYRMKVRKRVI